MKDTTKASYVIIRKLIDDLTTAQDVNEALRKQIDRLDSAIAEKYEENYNLKEEREKLNLQITKEKATTISPTKNNNTKNKNTGDWNSGDRNTGDWNSGDYNTGDRNTGDRNTGDRNTGDWNSGDYNTGDWNSGDYNSGDWNSGHSNTGDWNSGDRNSGNWNSGHRNSGNWNSGNCNSGNWNSGDYNSGNGYINFFCTEQKFILFDEKVEEEVINKIRRIPMGWFSLKGKSYHEAWANCPKEILSQFSQIPEFQTPEARAKFEEITGLELPEIR